jgi:hypothetical protein
MSRPASTEKGDGIGIEEMEAHAATELDLETNPWKDDNSPDQHQQSFLRQRFDNLMSIFLPAHAHEKKADLSHVNPLDWEQAVRKLEHPSTPAFRTSTPLRQILVDYMTTVEPLLHDDPTAFESSDMEDKVTIALKDTFHEGNLKVLDEIGHDVADVASWSWIFSAQNVDRAIRRYTTFAEDMRRAERGRIPRFVLLQILRAPTMSASALKELMNSILTELRASEDKKQYFSWNWVTRVCLVVRLLRHTRQVAPECFADVSSIIRHLFFEYYAVQNRTLGQEHPELLRLSHIFNRFLSLTALSTVNTPYNTYLAQQNAQLTLVRLMVTFKPQLPLTREGYRALIAVQLLHRKTGPERQWAEAKSPSWPPWRQIQSGIERDLVYPGRESRVMKLLGRMTEAGYKHGTWEKSAAVLAGWDTDKSPTIQTRAILMRSRQPWRAPPRSRTVLDSQSNDDAEVWAARIRATRSKREAWASFLAYEKSTKMSKRWYQPYYAMFDKLLAPTVASGSLLESSYVPGDLKEVFEDSSTARDMIYIEREVPSVDEFYEVMLRAGFYPGGHLLGSLLNHAPSIAAGVAYIHDSRWTEVTKDVLVHAEKYPSPVIRDNLNRLPVRSLSAFVWLLGRYGNDDSRPTFSCQTSSFDVVSGQSRTNTLTVSPLSYAWQLLDAGEVADVRVWNAYLRGAYVCICDAKSRSEGGHPAFGDDRAVKHEIWRRLWKRFHPRNEELDVRPDLEFFRRLAAVVAVQVRDANHRRLHVPVRRFGHLTKATFLRAVYGQNVVRPFFPPPTVPVVAVPGADDLRLLLKILVMLHDVDGVLALVRWMNEHAETFGSDDGTTPSDPDGNSPRSVLCALRLFLEGGPPPDSTAGHEGVRFHTPLLVDPDTVEQAQKYCAPLGWPSDDEVRVFLSRKADWLKRVAWAVNRRVPRRAHAE